jgi:hypothetical protein
MKSQTYSYEELVKVYLIYHKVKSSIHKSNKIIIKLANEIGRHERSVENQLLMFRAFERQLLGVSYGRRNYNSLIPEVYHKYNPMKDIQYPERFGNFRKSEKSSVSKLSNLLCSGSPVDFVRTPLYDFIDKVIESENFLRSKNILAIVGGAGNGKTESLGYILNQVRKIYGLFLDDEYLNERIIHSNVSNKGYFTSFSDSDFKLSVIQDATSVWVDNGIFMSKKESLIRSIDEAFTNVEFGLFVVCINRGVLSDIIRERDFDYSDIFNIVLEQVRFDSSLVNLCNLQEKLPSRPGFEISSYPLDRMRLFHVANVHERLKQKIIKSDWSSVVSQDHFKRSEKAIGELLDIVELTRNGLMSFRDYLNYMSILYGQVFITGWINIPAIKMWFGTQFYELVEVFERVLDQSEKSNLFNSLKQLYSWRNSTDELKYLESFDPLRIGNIIDSDDVQAVLDMTLVVDSDLPLIVSLNNVEYEIYGHYRDLLRDLQNFDKWLDDTCTDSTTDRYILKRYVFSLTAQMLTYLRFEEDCLFYLSDKRLKFLNLTSNGLIELFRKALDLKKGHNGTYVQYSQSLVDELWVYRNKNEISQKISIDLLIEEVDMISETLPEPACRVLSLKSNSNNELSMDVIIDFNQFCSLVEYHSAVSYYFENYTVSFSIWINSLKEGIRKFQVKNTDAIDVYGDVYIINEQVFE